MVEEGFEERHILKALKYKTKILEEYPDENRCLILGYFHFGERIISALHIVCDYSNKELIDIVTAYIPQKPWWISPIKRGK